jgi:hypothetical protein
MRISLMAALVSVAVLASTSLAHAQMSFSKGFDGGSVRCTTKTIRVLEPVSQKAPKKGREGAVVFNVETFEGEKHRYIFTGNSVKVGRRPVGTMRRTFAIKAWDFDCQVTTDVGVSHTCSNLKGTAGMCTVCTKDSCNAVTFRVTRKSA